MRNLVANLKRFISNKNTVTILAVLAGIIILWYFYNYRVNQAITTVRIPYAIERIDTRKKIETDNIEFREITRSSLRDNDLVENIAELDGKYICEGTSIPKNGFFHRSQICDERDISNSVNESLPDGYTLTSIKVTNETTYANSISPGDYIDLYMYAKDSNGAIYGKLIESIKVLEVRDSSGRSVFWDSAAGDSATLLFGVPDEYANLIDLANRISGIDIRPRLRGADYSKNPGETELKSEELQAFIYSQVTIVD